MSRAQQTERTHRQQAPAVLRAVPMNASSPISGLKAMRSRTIAAVRTDFVLKTKTTSSI